MAIIRRGFIKHRDSRFMNTFSAISHLEERAYAKELKRASLERLAHLIKICGFLMQMEI